MSERHIAERVAPSFEDDLRMVASSKAGEKRNTKAKPIRVYEALSPTSP